MRFNFIDRSKRPIQWVAEDRYRLWLHFGFWIFLYLDEMISLFGFGPSTGLTPMSVFIYLLIDLGTVYLNLYVFIPAYLLANRFWYYLGYTVITIFINIELTFLLKMQFFCPECPGLSEGSTLSLLVQDFANTTFVLGTAIGANIMRRFAKNRQRVQELETDNLKTELAFLKNQINPHFLFNSLNNIYVQTRKRPGEAAESVMLLSEMLRYQLYDCSKELVSLKNEIKYLRNYLELDRIRKSEMTITFDVKGDPGNKKVPPFLFIPFVENAVKHGATNGEHAFIDIRFQILEESLIFRISNAKKEQGGDGKPGGIGLNNVRRRLELLYPGAHHLEIMDEKNTFTVHLELNLSE